MLSRRGFFFTQKPASVPAIEAAKEAMIANPISQAVASAYPAPPPPPVRRVEMLDVECYTNYFLVKLYDINTKVFTQYELSAFHTFDRVKLVAHLHTATLVTFNGNKYDMPMVSAFMSGFNNYQLKVLSDAIIQRNMQPWEAEREFGFTMYSKDFDHIDLIEVAPGTASLKIYGGRLHCKRMQDLPIEPGAILTQQDMIAIALYCGNDLLTTADLYAALLEDIETREELTRQYCVDMRSKSDAQIAETAFKKLLNLSYDDTRRMQAEAYLPPGSTFKYETPAFIKFGNPILQQALAMIERVDFTIAASGSPLMPPELDSYEVTIGSSTYRMGIGGLHSTEHKVSHRADATYGLVDVDVVSYYPKIISILRMFPHQIGEVFLTIYDGWIEVRIEYKTKGNKKKAATFKIKINGTYGKTGSPYSILYAPKLMIRTTITGQLSLFMLIERLEAVDGISVVSANTDGIVIKCRRDLYPVRDAIVKKWEIDTGFETEANEYLALFSRDINNYLAFKPAYTDKKGVFHPVEVKSKGAYADPGLAKNPTNIICIDAVKAYMLDGVPLDRTIRQCCDIRKFVSVRAVKGGGSWVKGVVPDQKATKATKVKTVESRGWIPSPYHQEKGLWGHKEHIDTMSWHAEQLDFIYKSCFTVVERQYLGKAVRWYYGAGQKGHIATSAGYLVARTEGAKPCMDLPDVLPPDIDYDWYIREATDLLADLNCS